MVIVCYNNILVTIDNTNSMQLLIKYVIQRGLLAPCLGARRTFLWAHCPITFTVLSCENLKTANSNATIFYVHIQCSAILNGIRQYHVHIQCSAILNGIRQYQPNSWNNVICKYIIIIYKLNERFLCTVLWRCPQNCLNNILHSTNDETN